MKTRMIFAMCAAACICAGNAGAGAANPDSKISSAQGISIERVDFESSARRHSLAPSGAFAVLDEGTLLLQTKDNIFDLSAEKPVFDYPVPGLESFAVAPSGLVAVIADSKFGVPLDGKIQELVKLPSKT